jgi:hypothetical protein
MNRRSVVPLALRGGAGRERKWKSSRSRHVQAASWPVAQERRRHRQGPSAPRLSAVPPLALSHAMSKRRTRIGAGAPGNGSKLRAVKSTAPFSARRLRRRPPLHRRWALWQSSVPSIATSVARWIMRSSVPKVCSRQMRGSEMIGTAASTHAWHTSRSPHLEIRPVWSTSPDWKRRDACRSVQQASIIDCTTQCCDDRLNPTNIPPSSSASAAARCACVRRWEASAMPTTTPWPRTSSPASNAN